MKSVFVRTFVRAAIFALLLPMMLILCSCTQNERDHLSYQRYPIRAECVLFIAGEEYPLVLDVSSAGNARLTFTGSRLEGAVIGVSGRDVFFINGGHTFPLFAGQGSPLAVIARAFALAPSEMTEVDQGTDGTVIGYKCDRAELKVTLCDGIPVAMDAVSEAGSFELEINNFTCGAR